MKVTFGLFSIALLLCSYTTDMSAQTLNLQHHFIPTQAAQTQTRVKLSGDSLIGGNNAKTNLNLEMNRMFTIQNVEQNGQAQLNMQVLEMRTKGTMNDERFNETITGDKLQQTMFGATNMDVTVNPWGQVHATNPSMLKNLGISLPSEMSSGGFEFPTFPRGPVKVGSSWDENGILVQPNQTRSRIQQGEKVYRLKQIRPTQKGRMAVIEYRKQSDLSGLGLGEINGLNQAIQQMQQSGQLSGQLQGVSLPDSLSNGFQIPELTIQLEGEIHFNVDYGLVIESHQRGKWNMSADFPIQSDNKPKTRVNQKNMNIEIRTQFQWNKGDLISPPSQPQATPTVKMHTPPPIIQPEIDKPES